MKAGAIPGHLFVGTGEKAAGLGETTGQPRATGLKVKKNRVQPGNSLQAKCFFF